MSETEPCDWIELTLESNLRAELSPPAAQDVTETNVALWRQRVYRLPFISTHTLQKRNLVEHFWIVDLIITHRCAWHSSYLFKNNKFLKKIWKHSSIISSSSTNLRSYTDFLLFVFINLFIAIFSVVDLLFTKSVKVQTCVSTSKNLSAITIKHNDNVTVGTVATAESLIGEKSKLSTHAIS